MNILPIFFCAIICISCYAKEYDVVVVGSGLSGAVIAEQCASKLDKKVLVIEKRPHIGGNCYDYVNEKGLLVSKYGAHIFHTNDENVWKYIQKFSEWVPYEHKVVAFVEGKLVPIPVNILTVNMLCNAGLTSSADMRAWLFHNQVFYPTIENGEQVAKSRVGIDLYEKLFANYTYKQWGLHPHELEPSVLARIPVRDSFEDRYFTDKYQALPKYGYTKFIENILSHPNIDIVLEKSFFDIKDEISYNFLIFTGPIDAFYSHVGLPKLAYRSLQFDTITLENTEFFQPHAVVNYPEKEFSFTRIIEYKHFLSQKSPHTTIVREIPTSEGEPYYPIPCTKNSELYQLYKAYADVEKNVYFLGRLGKYQYLNMDQAISQALELAKTLR